MLETFMQVELLGAQWTNNGAQCAKYQVIFPSSRKRQSLAISSRAQLYIIKYNAIVKIHCTLDIDLQ